LSGSKVPIKLENLVEDNCSLGSHEVQIRIEHQKKQEHLARRKEVNQEESGNGNSRADSVNSGSGTDYQIYIPLG
jgi:hypothetical protein